MNFNPRARVGRDLMACARSRLTNYFNPRARVGRDTFHSLDVLAEREFQSTRPRGARPCKVPGEKALLNFNPRARVGRDGKSVKDTRERQISIHAPAWGATRRDRFTPPSAEFQSTRPRGARQGGRAFAWRLQEISIHAPAWGATLGSSYRNPKIMISIHAPAWGATSDSCRVRRRSCISIHAPAWGATVPVYTGLITAVTLYFSRTSFLAVLLQAFFVAKSFV